MDIVEEGAAGAGYGAGGVGARAASAGEWEREPHPSDSLRTFGAVVQALREHSGLSRVDLGARVQYSKHTVASVELGRRMPDESFVERAGRKLSATPVCYGRPPVISPGARRASRHGSGGGRSWSGRR